MSALRIALLTEIPAPFRLPLFRALAGRGDVELRVLFLADRDPRRSYRVDPAGYGFSARTLPGLELRRGGRWIVANRAVLAELVQFRPDTVVVGGWNQPAFWLAAAWARVARRPLVVWVESTARDERPGSGPLERAKRSLLAQAAGFLVPGRASAEYLAGLGVSPTRIATAPNAVDTAVFGDLVDELRVDRDGLRAELGLDRCTILYAGRLDPEKSVGTLVEAVRDLDAELVVVSGSDPGDLREIAPPNVRFVGWQEQRVLARWYAAADVFCLPSRSEQWGMVLNEAAAAGLPIVATEAAGAAWDLVAPGENGARVPLGDPAALRDALEPLVRDGELRRRYGVRSRELAAAFTPEAWGSAVEGLARKVTSHP